ncbi:uncharacterized protein Tco_0584538, partial [Tanacetum coccineum]
RKINYDNYKSKGANSESYKDLDEIRVNDDDNHNSNDELGVDIMGMSMDECNLNSNSVRSTKNDKYDKVGNNGSENRSSVSNDESELNVADGEKENKDDSDKMQVDHKDNMPQEINKLRNIPIGLNELGEEVVVFDEELVKLSTWEADKEKERNEMLDDIEGIVKDVLEDESIVVKNITANVMNGKSMNQDKKQKELKKFIYDEKLQVFSVIETHVKAAKLDKVCSKIYGQWDWVSNMKYCVNGCNCDFVLLSLVVILFTKDVWHYFSFVLPAKIPPGTTGCTWKQWYHKCFPRSSDALRPSSSISPSSTCQSNTIIHIDMDCLFVSFVIWNRPELWDKPVAVCYSDNPRGTSEISSANYPARDHEQALPYEVPTLGVVAYEVVSWTKKNNGANRNQRARSGGLWSGGLDLKRGANRDQHSRDQRGSWCPLLLQAIFLSEFYTWTYEPIRAYYGIGELEYDPEIEKTAKSLTGEDPHKHLKEFHVVCLTMKPREVTEEQIKLRAFPFSLADKAKDWLYYLPSGSITTWDQMKQQFLEKNFPASRAANIRKDMCGICQFNGETLYKYWERFKQLCASYAGSGRALVHKTPTEARTLILNMAANSQQFSTRQECPTKSVSKVKTSYDQRLDNLTALVENSPEQMNVVGGFPGPPQRKYDPFSNTYNPGWRNHPNFSYGSRSNNF